MSKPAQSALLTSALAGLMAGAVACGGSTPAPEKSGSDKATAEKTDGGQHDHDEKHAAEDDEEKSDGEQAHADGEQPHEMKSHACKGKNPCKGQGGCAVEGQNECKGKNPCKGKGGCKVG